MTFNDLISKYDWEEIHPVLLSLYYPNEEKNISGYRAALLELRFTVPTSSDSTIHIERVDEEDESYEDVYTRQAENDTPHGLDFVAWAEILSMQIDEGVFTQYPDLEIICHILFEITFYGYSSAKVEAEGSKLKDIVREIRDVEESASAQPTEGQTLE